MAEKLGNVQVGLTKGGNPKMRLQIRCECGSQLICSDFTNTCYCKRDYNIGGSLLAPRAQWGEETGESVSDILAVDSVGHLDEDWNEYQPW